MFQRFFAQYGHTVLLFLISIGVLFISGSRIDSSSMPNIDARVLSLFTDIPEGFVRVVDVSDGDTLVVEMDGKEHSIRLLGIDTPETRDPRRPVQCFGKEASMYTKSLVMGRAVRLVSDPQSTDRDSYDRLLRYVYLEDGSMLNERLVYDGYAFVYDEYPTGRTVVLKRMEEDAKKQKRGLWGGCSVSVKKSGKGHVTNSVEK